VCERESCQAISTFDFRITFRCLLILEKRVQTSGSRLTMVHLRLLTSSRPPSPFPASSRPHLSRLAILLFLFSFALCCLLHRFYILSQPSYPPGSLPDGARGQGAGSCRMSFMSPSYLHLSGFGREFTRLGNGPWGLYLYREAGWDEDPAPHPSQAGGEKADKLHLSGTPVLFVPGNAGSFRQVRSLAAAASRTWYEVPGVPRRSVAGRGNGAAPLDFFTLDFNDDFSAFHGQTLLDQAEYTADCVRYILSLYAHHEDDPPDHREKRPDPTSVIVVAHSMGGIVARAAVLSRNYQSGSISTMVTFATPHLVPPVTVDGGVDRVYRAVNSYWREAYGLAPLSSAAVHAAAAGVSLISPSFRRPPSEELANMVLVSLSGGLSDLTIASESVSLLSLLPSASSNGFTVFTTAIPGVQTPIDHLAILWCQQLMYKVAEGLLAVVDIRNPEQVMAREERVQELAKRWLGDSSTPNYGKGVSWGRVTGGSVARALTVGERLVVDALEGERELYLIPIPQSRTYSGMRVFSLLTSSRIGRRKDDGVEVYACPAVLDPSASNPFLDEDAESDKTSSTSIESFCTPLFPSHVTHLPNSPHASISPVLPAPIGDDSDGLVLVIVEAADAVLKGMGHIAVVVKEAGRGRWVLGEWADREKRTKVVEAGVFGTSIFCLSYPLAFILTLLSLVGLALAPFKFALLPVPASFAGGEGGNPTSPAALVSELWVPALDTSLLTLRVKVRRGSCHGALVLHTPSPFLLLSCKVRRMNR
jgi:glycosylphosphatidylinositol deacylase